MAIRTENNNSIDLKTEQLLLYIAEKCKESQNFGATHINKILYYVDNINYLKTGKPISKFTYIRQEFGPTPKPALFLGLRDKLVNEGKISIDVVPDIYGYKQKRIVNKKYPLSLSEISAEEISLIDDIINACTKYNAITMSNLTHDHLSWKIVKEKEDIPYYAYLLTKASLDENDLAWADEKIKIYDK